MKKALAIACLTSSALLRVTNSYSTHVEKDKTDHPNNVIIMVDDMGYSDLGCYGAAVIETPQIDRIAENGLRMRHFYNTAKCHSSRVSLLSGLWCDQAGSNSLQHAVTFPQLLKTAGYHTGMIGKWHLNDHPMDWGFDKYFGNLSGATDYIAGNSSWRLGREQYTDFGDSADEFYATDAMTDYAISFIHDFNRDDKPFALYLAYNAPHSPMQAPEALVKKYRGKYMDGWVVIQQQIYENQIKKGVIDEGTQPPPWPAHHRRWEETSDLEKTWEDYRRAIFAAMVESLDANIGRLVSELTNSGEWKNTVFMFFSDNGADSREIARGIDILPWNKGSWLLIGTEWAGVGNTPFRWYKQNQHNGGNASPMIISWPKGLQAEGWSNFRSHLVDIYPTLLDLTGISYPETYDNKQTIPLVGISLLPILKGMEPQREEPIYFKFASSKAVIDGNMKLVSSRNGPWELYDLDKDPTELNDLSALKPELVQTLRGKWLEIAKSDGNSARDIGVNDYNAPWGTRSYSNPSINADVGDPNPVEQRPVWNRKPPLDLQNNHH